MSASRRKGTIAESGAVTYLNANGFPHAERCALHGSLDRGDITGCPGICWECKSCGAISWPAWLREVEAERYNARADLGLVIYKPTGVGIPNAAMWHVGMSAATWDAISPAGARAEIFGATRDMGPLLRHCSTLETPSNRVVAAQVRPRGSQDMPGDWPVFTYLHQAVTLLRMAGYGDPLEVDAGAGIPSRRH